MKNIVYMVNIVHDERSRSQKYEWSVQSWKHWCKNNNAEFKSDQLYNKNGFKGLQGEFLIKKNFSKQKLKIYKVQNKKFIKVY